MAKYQNKILSFLALLWLLGILLVYMAHLDVLESDSLFERSVEVVEKVWGKDCTYNLTYYQAKRINKEEHISFLNCCKKLHSYGDWRVQATSSQSKSKINEPLHPACKKEYGHK